MIDFVARLGPLRLVLLMSVVILILAAPFAGDTSITHGWRMLTTMIFPVLVPMYFFVLPLDMTMCGIMMQDKPGPDRIRYKYIIRLELVLLGVLLLAWMPFAYRLVNV